MTPIAPSTRPPHHNTVAATPALRGPESLTRGEDRVSHKSSHGASGRDMAVASSKSASLHEETRVDTAEPSAIGELLEAAACGSSATITAQSICTAHGVTTALYVPPSELAIGTAFSAIEPTWMRFGALYHPFPNALMTGSLSLCGVSRGAGATTSRGTAGQRTAAYPVPTFRGPLSGDGSGGVLPPEQISTYAQLLLATGSRATTTSYAELELRRTSYESNFYRVIQSLCVRSRVASGVGALPGRTTMDVDAADESGYTALFISASTGLRDAVEMLLAAGADASKLTKRGKSPLYAAVEKGHVDVMELLLPLCSAAQLRANTTYGTNVMHAANKSCNNRVKEMLNT